MNKSQLSSHPGAPDRFFASYSLPGSEKITTILQADPHPRQVDIRQLENRRGFVVAAFPDQLKMPDLFIEADTIIEHPPLSSAPDTLQAYGNNYTGMEPVDKSTYLKLIEQTVAKLKKGPMKKVVLSRTIAHPVSSGFDPAILFNALTVKYPDAFVYFFNLPGYGSWIGATPEVLLHHAGGRISTSSLAGTKKKEAIPILWTEKELEEQEMVSGFIEERFRQFGVEELEIRGPESRSAGSFAHLHTTFTINDTALKGQLGNFLTDLHPTPAVCGLPREEALHYIHTAEQHDRQYYTGFLGPVGINDTTRLFVNLRCLQVLNDRLLLYVGGGITASSVAEDEWEETCMKAGTMLNVIKHL